MHFVRTKRNDDDDDEAYASGGEEGKGRGDHESDDGDEDGDARTTPGGAKGTRSANGRQFSSAFHRRRMDGARFPEGELDFRRERWLHAVALRSAP